MKNTVSYLFIVFLATLVFYGGAGINLVTYCCGDCRTEGVEVLLDDKCCEIHDHDHSEAVEEKLSASGQMDEESCCNLERVSFDWNSSTLPSTQLQPAVVDLFSFGTLHASLIPSLFFSDCLFQETDRPPLVGPRVYLSLLNVLLI